MKLYSIALFSKAHDGIHLLAHAKDVTSFGYFQRGSIGEFMDFFSKTVVERSSTGARQSVKEQDYVFHVHVRQDNTAGVVICDSEYPSRVAFSLISKCIDEFQKKYPKASWTGNPSDTPFVVLDQYLVQYQKPEEADSLMKVQKDLDETKVILHQTMESVLARGEKMEDLIAKSDELSSSSKMFYKQAKKANSCCTIQ